MEFEKWKRWQTPEWEGRYDEIVSLAHHGKQPEENWKSDVKWLLEQLERVINQLPESGVRFW